MKILILPILAGTLLAQSSAPTFAVEKLTTPELTRLSAAQEAARLAAVALQDTERAIKESHGQTKSSSTSNLGCGGSSTSVEIRSDYALISTSFWNACVSH